MIQVSLVGYMVGGSFLGLAYWDLPYTLAAIVLLMRRLVEEEKLPQRAAVRRRPAVSADSDLPSLARAGQA
jgi:hypothetical protein